jgi:N-acetyltransferase 10
MLIKCVRKFAKFYRELFLKKIEKKEDPHHRNHPSDAVKETELQKKEIENSSQWTPSPVTLTEDLDGGALEIKRKLREKQKELLSTLDLEKYAIFDGEEEEWDTEIRKKKKNLEGSILNIGRKAVSSSSKDEKKNDKSFSEKLLASKDKELIKKAKKSKYAK